MAMTANFFSQAISTHHCEFSEKIKLHEQQKSANLHFSVVVLRAQTLRLKRQTAIEKAKIDDPLLIDPGDLIFFTAKESTISTLLKRSRIKYFLMLIELFLFVSILSHLK